MPILYLVLTLIIVAAVASFINTKVQMPDNVKPVVNLVLALIVVGMVLWLINTFVPMAGSIKTILNIVVVVATCVFVLQTVGLWSRAVNGSASLWARMTAPRPAAEKTPAVVKVPENAKPAAQPSNAS
jgi:predicted membrane protein